MSTDVIPAPLSGQLKLWRYRVFAATWLSYIGFYICRKPYSIVKKDLGDALHFAASDLALIYASYLIAYTIGQFLSGAVGPRFGPRNMLLVGMSVTAACGVAFGFSSGLAVFVGLMAVNGLAQATGWSNNVGTMATWFARQERGRVMGLWATNFQVGGVIANGLAAFVLAHLGWVWSFWAGSAVMVGILAFFWFNQANRPQDKGLPPVTLEAQAEAASGVEQQDEAWSTGTWISVGLVGMAYFGMKFIRYALWSWAPFVLSKNFHLKGDDAGYVSTLFDLCGIAGVVATGWLSDKLFGGRRATISLIMLVATVAATGLLFTVGAQSVTMFAICIGLVGFTLFGPDALLTGAGAMDIGKGRGAVRAAGIISGLGSAGSVLQELVIGKSFDATGGAIGPILGMLLGAAVMAALCVAAILVRNRMGQSDV